MNRETLYFLASTFLLTYGFLGVLVFTELHVESTTGFILLFLGGSAPTFMALIMVHRCKAVDRTLFYQSLLKVRMHPKWYGVAFGVPLALGGLAGIILLETAFEVGQLLWVPLFIVNGILFGGLEEVGWRGVLQAQNHRYSIVAFGVVFGVIWGLWHLPMFYIEGLSHYDYAFLPYLLQAIVLSLWLTLLYDKTRSIPIVVLFHAMINTTAALGLGMRHTHSISSYAFVAITMGITVGVFRISAANRPASLYT